MEWDTNLVVNWMNISLRTKLILAFLAVTVILFGLISLFANVLLDKQFKEYVIDQQEKENQAVVAVLSNGYQDWGNTWDATGIEIVGANALERGLMLRIEDKDGTVLWDAMVHNSGRCAAIIQNMTQIMERHYENFKGGYVEKSYPITIDEQVVGTTVVGYYGPYFYTESDIQFLNTLNRLLKVGAGIAMILALGLGIIIAKQLSTPIKRVTAAARHIADGNLRERVVEKSTTTEIVELTDTVNSMADSLEKQEILRKRLTADVAHELRTPLATLQSHIEAILDGVWEMDADRLKLCHEETVRLAKIVQSLEELTKYDQENMQINKSPINLNGLVEKVAKTFEAEFLRKGVDISLDLPAKLSTLAVDEDKMTQALINLVSNSLKFTPEGRNVTMSLNEEGKYYCITVADTGVGISEEDMPYIFERFFRADQSRNKKTGGSGIGLAIVKSIVEAHGGRVEVQSQRDKGSVFKLYLPKA
jgi:two-component system, OmpR family, sensor histidine kinase BaeS